MAALALGGSIVSSMVVLQGAQALLTAFVLFTFQKRFGNPLLAYWTIGWMALACQLAAVAGYAVLAAREWPTNGVVMTVVVAFMLACRYLRVGWLLIGAFALALGREVSLRTRRAVVLGSLAAAVLSCLPFITGPDAASRFLVRAGLVGGVTGLALLGAGIVLFLGTMNRVSTLHAYWPRTHGEPALGQRLVATAFLGLGGVTLVSLVRGIADPPQIDIVPIVPMVNEGLLMLNFALGLGLIIWLLEAEQRRTLESAQRAEHMAYHDALTGLPNRLLLVDRLRVLVAHARRAHESFAVFFLDVDHFKAINDSRGHAAGDRVLQQIAVRLTSQLREADTVARLGGDEFVILTPDLTRGADVKAVGEKLLEVVRLPVLLDNDEIHVTVSIGVSLFPDDGEDADSLLRRSDDALYVAKGDGRNAVRLA